MKTKIINSSEINKENDYNMSPRFHIEKKETEEEFNNLIEKLNDKEFWEYIRSWFDEEYICNIMRNWDIETKKEEIKTLKKILKGGLK